MSQGITTDTLRRGIERISAMLEASQEELNTADGRLGDGDIGISMVNGLRGIRDELDQFPDDVGMALLQCAQAFSRTGGSSFGTLLATGLMGAAKETRGRLSVPWSEVPQLLQVAIDRMASRGRSQLGDKTVLDALDAARQAVDGLDQPDVMLVAANEAVAAALDRFRSLPCRQGRARIFGERSSGLDDPGMLVIRRMLEGLADRSLTSID